MPPSRSDRTIAAAIAALVALIAPFLAGSSEVWSQGIVVALIGAGILAAPPRRAPHRLAPWVCVAALLLAGTALLPAAWMGAEGFHRDIERLADVRVTGAVSPQPVVTMEAIGLLLAGLAWWWWTATTLGSLEQRERLARWVAAGVIVFAGIALLEEFRSITIPFWPEVGQIGSFPNRNQFGDILGTWAVVAAACGVCAARERRWACGLWVLGLGVIFWALIIVTSRASLIVFFAGLALWGIREGIASRQVGKAAVAIAAGLCVAALFFAFGGEARLRLARLSEGGLFSTDFRFQIFRDTLALIAQLPWCGMGLGNFESIFALHRVVSAPTPKRVVHPESDWLWLGSEMGWLAPVLVVVLLSGSLLARRSVERRAGSPALMAATIGGLLFLAHGFVDVSGHRLGSALPGILLLTLSAAPPKPGKRSAAPWAWTFRLIGLALLGGGLMWVAAGFGKISLPGQPEVAHAKAIATAANESEEFPVAISAANRGLQWAPLDWELYFLRAVAHLYSGDREAALRDFRRVRRLESSDITAPFQEGILWAHFDPDQCFEAWREGLRRADTMRENLFRQMVGMAGQNPIPRAALQALLEEHPDLRVWYWETADGAEFMPQLQRWLQADPELGMFAPAERQAIVSLWWRVGDREALAAWLRAHPRLREENWRLWARVLAKSGDVRGAVELWLERMPPPSLPRLPDLPLDVAQRAHFSNPENAAAIYQTYRAELLSGALRDAAATLEKLKRLPQPPPYAVYLRAKVFAQLGEWEAAWRELGLAENAWR